MEVENCLLNEFECLFNATLTADVMMKKVQICLRRSSVFPHAIAIYPLVLQAKENEAY